MCFFKSPKPPKVPSATPRPKTDETSTLAGEQRRKSAEQKGVFGNIFTSALGDASYGANVNSRLGGGDPKNN